MLVLAGAFASPASALPNSMAALGDSLTRGYGSAGAPSDNPSASWSTGSDTNVNSHYLRLLARTSAINGNAANYAVSGSKMADTYAQAGSAVSQGAGYVTILSGTNDVCTSTVAQMTSVADYSSQLQSTLVRLTSGLPQARILVASIPDWYKLYQTYSSDPLALNAWSTYGRCPDLLGSGATNADRLAVAQRITDLNAAAASTCAGFPACTYDGGAVYGLGFASTDLAFDYFHFSVSGEALVAAATWNASPFVFYDSFPIDAGCGGCNLAWKANGELTATIQGGADTLDTAYGLKDFGSTGGLSGRVYSRTILGLAQGQVLNANAAVFQVRDVANALVYELYIGADRILRLWSPAGGLRATQSINLSTGVVVPNDGSSSIRAEVSALANDSVIVRVDGVDRITVTGLSGATTGNQRYLRAGIDHYDTGTSAETVRVIHGSVATSQSGWLGAPEGTPTPAPTNTALPTISGTAQQGQTLTASNGSWTNSPTSFAYQWRRCDSGGNNCSNIGGATSSTYTLTAGDVNFTIRVVVTASNAGGSNSATSAQTALVQAAPSSGNLAPNPGFESDPNVDYSTVGAGTFSWASDAFHGGSRSIKVVTNQSSLSRWLSQTSRISAKPGTTYSASAWFKTSAVSGSVWLTVNFWSSSLTFLGATVGDSSPSLSGTQNWTQLNLQTTAPAGTAYIRVEFRIQGGPGTFWADDVLLTEGSAPPPSPPTNTSLPTISGTAQQGQTLTANNGSWTNSPTSFAYQWRQCDSGGNNCGNIGGATGSTYTLTSGDVNLTIRVVVTASNSGGSNSATSAQTAVVQGPPPAPTNTSLPTISGTAQQGQTLTASNGSWTNNPTSFGYQWRQCDSGGNNCGNIGGASSSTYALTAGDVNFTIRVVVTASNSGGSNSATSAQTALVQAAPSSSNLAPNPGFESNPFTDYTTYPNVAANTFTWASDAAHGGTRSLKLASTQASGALARWLSQTSRIPATAGTTYTASAWFKTSGVSEGAYLSVNFWSSSFTYLGATAGDSSPTIGGTQNWTQLNLQTTAPPGTAYIRVEFRLTGPGTFWADDVLLTKTP